MSSEELRIRQKVALPNPRLIVMAYTGMEEGRCEILPIGGVDPLMARAQPRVRFDLPQDCGLPKEARHIDLKLSALSSFSPDGLATLAQPMSDLADGLKALKGCARGEVSMESIQKSLPEAALAALRETEPAAEPAPVESAEDKEGDSPVDALLAMVEQPAGSGTEPELSTASLADTLGAVVSDSSSNAETRRIKRACVALEKALTAVSKAIIEHPEFQRLEATWRGLDLLVRAAGAQGVEVEVVEAPKEVAADIFFDELFQREYNRTLENPAIGLLLAYRFTRNSEDLEDLDAFARFGESLRLPVLASIGTDFWGVKKPRLLAGLPDLAGRFNGPEFVKWRSLRQKERASWLFLAANRFVARAPWGGETSARIRSFAWRAKTGEPLWSDCGWLLAGNLCKAYVDSEMHCRLTEAVAEDLPMVEYATPRGDRFAYPLEVRLRNDRVEDLARLGFSAPVADPGTGSVVFEQAPSFFQPEVYNVDEASRASERAARLEQRVFAALTTYRVDRVSQELMDKGVDDPEQTVDALREALLPLLEDLDEDSRQLSLEVDAGGELEEAVPAATSPQVLIRIRPDYAVGGGPVDLVLATPLVTTV